MTRSVVAFPLLLLLLQRCACTTASEERVVRRRLEEEYQKLGGYTPFSIITDQAAIDLDASAVAAELSAGRRTSAESIYINGAHSKSVANLKLKDPLPMPVAERTTILGLGPGSVGLIRGYALDDHSIGSDILRFVYAAVDDQENYMMCQVGANPEPVTERCLVDEGYLDVAGHYTKLSYTYSVLQETSNARTLSGFSTEAREQFGRYEDYLKFVRYFGRYDYADHWIKQAFLVQGTQMNNGNVAFQIIPPAEQSDAISVAVNDGILLLSVWMQVVGTMNRALDTCDDECQFSPDSTCNDKSANIWEEAAAFYIGSLQGEDGNGSGVLLYEHAERLCDKFNTCGRIPVEGTKLANSNRQVVMFLEQGRRAIAEGKCEAAEQHKDLIVRAMTIPLIQHVIQMAYELEVTDEPTTAIRIQAATAAAALLPLVHNCSATDATYVYEWMKFGSNVDKIQAKDIKATLERNYRCMRITCDDVGGLLGYFGGSEIPGLEMCDDEILLNGHNNDDDDDQRKKGAIVGLVFGGMAFVALGVLGAMQYDSQIGLGPDGTVEPQLQGDGVAA